MPRIISQMVWLEGKEGSEPSSSSMCVASDFAAPCGETAKVECEKGIEGQKACNDYRYGSLNLPDTNSLYISPQLCGDCKYSKIAHVCAVIVRAVAAAFAFSLSSHSRLSCVV